MKKMAIPLLILTALSFGANASTKSTAKPRLGCTVYFAPDSSSLSLAGQALIQRWVKILNKLPRREVMLTGYMLQGHPLEYAMAVSGLLSAEVEQAMKDKGLKKDIIVNTLSRGHAELNPHVRDYGKARVELDALTCAALKAALH